MQTAKQILDAKGHKVWDISPYATVYNALESMRDKEIGALVVVEGGKVVGIITERDYTRKIVLRGKSSKDTPVREIMTDTLHRVRPDSTAEQCLSVMIEKGTRHLLVFDKDQLMGVLSMRDLVKSMLPGGEKWASPSLLET